MRVRRSAFIILSLAASYVAVAGCSDDEPAAPVTVTEAGSDATAIDATADRSAPDALDARSPEFTGSACTAAADCYGDIDGAALKGGAPVCIDKVTGGYCTHTCTTDADCCAVPGECRTGLKQVCSSFENAAEKYCFLSCEDADIAAATDAGASDAGAEGDEYCQKNTTAEFGCRSTGGGSENRKVCLPLGPVGDGGGGNKKDAGDGGDADAN